MAEIGLGTVQFGQAYGVSNTSGQVAPDQAAKIIARAAQAGIRVLDTAPNYAAAESVLAGLNTGPLRIVTKTIGLQNGLDAVLARARQSAKALGADTLLVHAAADLKDSALWPALQRLKADGVVRKIGISAYVADDPATLLDRFAPDVMQLPLSLLDQRLLQNGALAKLKQAGVEIHARSIFLQGLLFLETLPETLWPHAQSLLQIKRQIAAKGSTPLQAALGFVLSRPEVDVALVGVTSLQELDEILALAAAALPMLDWQALALHDETLLTPSLW